MGGRDDRGRMRPGFSPGDGDSPAGDDVLESGRWRTPVLRWRPPPVAVVLGVAGLVAGLAAGYAVGVLRAGNPAAPSSRSRAAATAAPSAVAGDYPLSQSGPQCSARIGRELQLGEQVTNQSAAAVTLRRVEVILPLRGLAPVSQAWGPCGELPALSLTPGNVLPAGASTWFTVTFRVLVRCPQPLPVQFRLLYDLHGRPAGSFLPGFDDLGQVPYAACP